MPIGRQAPQRRIRNQRGLTLLEVTAAFSVLGLVMLCLIYVLANSALASNQSRDRLRATSLASSFLEYLGTTKADDLTRFDGVDTRDTDTYPEDESAKAICQRWQNDIAANLDRPGAFGSVSVEANSPNPGRTRITIRVGWQTGTFHSVTLVEVR